MRSAEATKNVPAGVMNASAVALVVTSQQVRCREALALGTGAVPSGLPGSWRCTGSTGVHCGWPSRALASP